MGERDVTLSRVGGHRHLAYVPHRPNFALQVIPAGMGGHAVPSGFTILRFSEPDLPDVAYLEHLLVADMRRAVVAR